MEHLENPIVLIQSNDAGDRSAFICVLMILIFQYLKTRKVDIFQTIRRLRQSRSNMISTLVCNRYLLWIHHYFE